MKSAHLSNREISLAALGIALIAVCSWISVPMTIPFTMQTFAICLISSLYGLKLGIWTVLAYILLGSAGLPVFAGFSGGPAALIGVTGGYLIGFLFTALVVGYASDRFGCRFPVMAVSMAAGVILCYVFGTAWFMIVYSKNTGPIGLWTALSWCVIPYLIPDGVKVFLAAVLAERLSAVVRPSRMRG